MMGFAEIKRGVRNGVFAEFGEGHAQRANWNFRNSNLATNERLSEYRQSANGLAFGRWLRWNPQNEIEIGYELQNRYDWNGNYRQFPLERTRPTLRAGNVREIAGAVAQVKGCSRDGLSVTTCETAFDFFPRLRGNT